MILITACAAGSPHPASAGGNRPQHATGVAKPARQAAPSPAASLAPATPATPAGSPTPAPHSGPHFATPQAAMTCLATAYNSDDVAALHAVTNPGWYMYRFIEGCD